MSFARYSGHLFHAVRGFLQDMRAALSIELIFAIPLLIWAYLGMAIFQDAFRAKMEGEAAALHIADLISRNTDEITVDYLEGMNDVFDFLTTRTRETRLRISSVMLDTETGEPHIVWSHGTRGLSPLVDMRSTSNDEGEGTGFGNSVNQLPIEQLERRIPTILPGEALILVETFALWKSPLKTFMGLKYLDDIRLAPLAVTRPRFSPFIRFENDNDVFPEMPPEFLPPVGEPEAPTEPEEPPAPEPQNVTLIDTNFSDGDLTGWTNARVTHSGSNSYLGPFGGETRSAPVTFNSQYPGTLASKQIEFQLMIIGSWDGHWMGWAAPEGEFLMIQINGESIALDPFQVNPNRMFLNNRNTFTHRAEGLFHTHMYIIENIPNAPEHGWQPLQVWQVRINVQSPDSAMTIGLSANLNEGIDNESFAIRNFRITALTHTSGERARFFQPDVATYVGQNPLNAFPVFNGCPAALAPAPAYTILQQNLDTSERFRVQARGGQTLAHCSGFTSAQAGFVASSPTAVLNWVDQGGTGTGSRLQIRTNDGSSGLSCNSALLVLDAYGQWHYNRNISLLNLDARLQLGIAGTGPHYIWVLREGTGACFTDIQFSLY
jgi:hypothetical protein